MNEIRSWHDDYIYVNIGKGKIVILARAQIEDLGSREKDGAFDHEANNQGGGLP